MMQNPFLRPDFAKRLITLRQSHSLHQRELAQRAGVHQVMISNLERSQRGPSLDLAIKLADALETTLDFLILGR